MLTGVTSTQVADNADTHEGAGAGGDDPSAENAVGGGTPGSNTDSDDAASESAPRFVGKGASKDERKVRVLAAVLPVAAFPSPTPGRSPCALCQAHKAAVKAAQRERRKSKVPKKLKQRKVKAARKKRQGKP